MVKIIKYNDSNFSRALEKIIKSKRVGSEDVKLSVSRILAYLKRALSLFFLISSKILETDNLTSSEPTLFDLIIFSKAPLKF